MEVQTVTINAVGGPCDTANIEKAADDAYSKVTSNVTACRGLPVPSALGQSNKWQRRNSKSEHKPITGPCLHHLVLNKLESVRRSSQTMDRKQLTRPKSLSNLILLNIFISGLCIRFVSPLIHRIVVLLNILRRLAMLRRALVEDLGLGALRTFALSRRALSWLLLLLLLLLLATLLLLLSTALLARTAVLADRRCFWTWVLEVLGGVLAQFCRFLADGVAFAGAIVLSGGAAGGEGDGAGLAGDGAQQRLAGDAEGEHCCCAVECSVMVFGR